MLPATILSDLLVMMTLVYLFTSNYAGLSNPFMALVRGMAGVAQVSDRGIGSDIVACTLYLGCRNSFGPVNGYLAPAQIRFCEKFRE